MTGVGLLDRLVQVSQLMQSGKADGRRRRLRLNRETLRTVSAPDLAQVVGGAYVVLSGGCGFNAAPKSNAWTGGAGAAASCGA